jgi:tRNA(fMet)-specific endonuclease VapC
VNYILDTDHISILQHETGPEFTALSARMSGHPDDDFAFSIVSFHEQAIGAHALINRARNASDVIRGYQLLGRVIRDFTTVPVLLYDSAAASKFQDLASRRLRVATMDLRIASIALARGLTLLTRNARDFGRVPGLVVEDWTA